MATKSRPRTKRGKHTLRLNLPRPVWAIITKAARTAELTPDQMVTAILALAMTPTPPTVRP